MIRAAVATAAAAAALAWAGPAVGCTGVAQTEAEQFATADVVFAGTVTGRDDPNAGAPIQSSADPITWTFAVDATTKGDAATVRTVTSARDSSTCGYRFRIGARYAVFASRGSGGSLTTGEVSGTRPLAPGEGAPLYASRGMTLAAAYGFGRFPIYWAGPYFEGLALSQIVRRGSFVTAIYGTCTASDDQGCAPPLEIQTVRMCRATIHVVPLRDRRPRRGVMSGRRGGGLVLATGRQEVRIFGSGRLTRRALAALTGLNPLVAATGPGDPLPATLPRSAQGRMPCIPGRR